MAEEGTERRLAAIMSADVVAPGERVKQWQDGLYE